MKTKLFKVAGAALLLGCVAGMAACEDVDPASTDAISGDPDARYTRTIVEMSPDGNSRVVWEGTVSRERQLLEAAYEDEGYILDGRGRVLDDDGAVVADFGEIDSDAGSARSAISQDTSCSSTSLRVWETAGYTGGEICFTGTGTVDLRNYCRVHVGATCTQTWATHKNSFKTGNTGAQFDNSTVNACCQNCTARSSSTDVDPASACEISGVYVGRASNTACAPC